MSRRTTARRRSRGALLAAALLNLLPPVAFALVVSGVISLSQFSLAAGTGSLAAAGCTLYALHRASPARTLHLLLGAVAVLAAALFLGGDALVRAMPTESIGPGLVPLMGLLLHLCAAVTLFTLGLIQQIPSTSSRRR